MRHSEGVKERNVDVTGAEALGAVLWMKVQVAEMKVEVEVEAEVEVEVQVKEVHLQADEGRVCG